MTKSETVSAGLDGITGSARTGCSPLDLIQKVFPIRSLLHVGTGLKRALDAYRDLAVPSVVFVETGGADLGRLSSALGDRAGYSLHQAWLAEVAGDAVCYSASNIRENGLIKPESLAALWQNLKTRSEMPVETVTLDQFVDASVTPEVASALNWIVIDQLQAGAVAKGGCSLIARCDVVVARLVLDDSLLPEASGFSKTDFDALMAEIGLVHIATEPEVHPGVARCFYVRDWKQQLQSELGAFRAQAQGRQVALEGELASLRETLRAAAARSAEEISRLASERDVQAALATKRAEHVQHLTKVRDTQMALARTNENEIKRLRDLLILKPPMYNFKGVRRLEQLADENVNPKVYLEVKSLPRSGLHYLRNSLEHILGTSFSFCEWYHEPGCCGNMPCALSGIMENDDRPHLRMTKSHDFNLLDPPYAVNGSSIQRLILVRDPLYVLTSWWALDVIQANAQMLAKNNINVSKIYYLHEKAVVTDAFALIEREGVLLKEDGLEAWLKGKQSYISGFVDKWCNPKEPLGDVVSYGDGKQHVLRLLEPFIETMSEQSRHMLDEFREGGLDAFRPRKSAFDGPTERVTRFLHDHAKAFEATAKELDGLLGGDVKAK